MLRAQRMVPSWSPPLDLPVPPPSLLAASPARGTSPAPPQPTTSPPHGPRSSSSSSSQQEQGLAAGVHEGPLMPPPPPAPVSRPDKRPTEVSGHGPGRCSMRWDSFTSEINHVVTHSLLSPVLAGPSAVCRAAAAGGAGRVVAGPGGEQAAGAAPTTGTGGGARLDRGDQTTTGVVAVGTHGGKEGRKESLHQLGGGFGFSLSIALLRPLGLVSSDRPARRRLSGLVACPRPS